MNYLKTLTQGILLLPDKIGDYLSALTRGLISTGISELISILSFRVKSKYSIFVKSPIPYSKLLKSFFSYNPKATSGIPYSHSIRNQESYSIFYRGHGKYSLSLKVKGAYHG